MKGRTRCPECNYEIVLDMPKDDETIELVCPQCNNKFKSQAKCNDGECSWEEHGEPRKTILSSIRPKTNMPKIAAILLIIIFALGVSTSVFSEVFIETSLDVASGLGAEGTVKIKVINQDNESLKDVKIDIYQQTNYTNNNGIFYEEKLKLGITKINISKDGYGPITQEIIITPLFDSDHTITLKRNETKTINSDFDPMGCTIILGIFSVFALLAAISCIQRKHIDVAMAGAFIGILSFGFFFIGSALSIVAFFLIFKSRDEFENGKKGKIF